MDNCNNSDEPILIFIPLLEIKDPINNLLNEWFSEKRFGNNAGKIVEYLKKRDNVCFILDGLDEIDQFQKDPKNTKNLYETNELWRWTGAKFIISCRTTFLSQLINISGDETYKKYFIPIDDEKPRYDLFMELQIALFDTTQINRYIEEYVKLYPDKLTSEQYKHNIKALKIESLISNPLVLSMTAQALPIIIAWHDAKKKTDPNTFILITERDIFMAYLKDSIIRQITKLDHKNLGSEISLKNVRSELLNFLINLASQMKVRKISKIEYKFCPDELIAEYRNQGEEWATIFFGDPFLKNKDQHYKENLENLERVRNGATCLIFCEAETWRFMHDSFIDKLYSIVIVELTNIASKMSPSHRPRAGQINKRTIDEFSRVLFSQAEGPYYLTGKHWSSTTYDASETSEAEHTAQRKLIFDTKQINDIALKLRKDSADPNVAAAANYREFVKTAVSLGAHLIQGPGSGNTALHFALIKNQLLKATILVQLIIELDPEFTRLSNIKNTAGDTVLELSKRIENIPDELLQSIVKLSNFQHQDAKSEFRYSIN